MIPCADIDDVIHARRGRKTLCDKDAVFLFSIADGQWGEKDEQQPPLRWCKECEGFLTARGLVESQPKRKWADELIAKTVKPRDE